MKRKIGPEEQRFYAIMNSRFPVSIANAGAKVVAKITSATKGVWNDKLEALVDIYNLNLYKAEVVDSDVFQEGLAKAIALETSGDPKGAQDTFNRIMNMAQLTTNVINRDGTKEQFNQNDRVNVYLGTAEAPDRDLAGNVLTTTHKSVIAEGITEIKASVLPKGRRFGAEIEEEAPATPVAAAKSILQA